MSDTCSPTGYLVKAFLRSEAKDKQRLEEEGIDLTQPHVVVPVNISHLDRQLREAVQADAIKRGITIAQWIAGTAIRRARVLGKREGREEWE